MFLAMVFFLAVMAFDLVSSIVRDPLTAIIAAGVLILVWVLAGSWLKSHF